ncbi:MAG: zinc dependent phospholipase C family protein [Deltaproteobacteria bacterium]|nr:zinc dependent phospholipase C family protein [Deltaproteobacteria bacterium]
MIAILIISFIILIGLPQEALAWGPATHLEVGQMVLDHAHEIPAAIAALIGEFPYDFLYGNISADIVVGKNLVEELKHCHGWNFGFKLLKKAGSDSQRAFAYGYLCHLASDSIAHNHFIPEMMVKSFSARLLRHGYWELRFDLLAGRGVWEIPKNMVKSVHRDNDRLLRDSLEDTPLSFRTNKTIFSGILSLNRIEHWHRMLGILSSKSRWALTRKEKDRYLGLSVDAAMDFLSHGTRAACTRKDPVGRDNLRLARATRKKLRTVRRKRGDWHVLMTKALDKLAVKTYPRMGRAARSHEEKAAKEA